MSTIKTIINGVPVELEFVNAADGDITLREVQVQDGNGGSKVNPISSLDQSVRVISVGSAEKPASPEDVVNISNAVANSNASTIISEVSDLLNNIKDISGKEIWQSKVVWLNVLSIAATIAAHFGFDFKAHGINEETLATILVTAVGIINLYLRKGTDTPLKTPTAASVKTLVAPMASMFAPLSRMLKK